MKKLYVTFPDPCSVPFDEMSAQGCNRFCDKCETTVHDLEHLSVEEIESMLDAPGRICVRAKIGRNGEMQMRSGRSGRKLIATLGAGVGLLASAPSALAKEPKRESSIEGETYGYTAHVIAERVGGQKYMARVKNDGSFQIKHVQPGSYTITYITACGRFRGNPFKVEAGQVVVAPLEESDCIVVGMIERHDFKG